MLRIFFLLVIIQPFVSFAQNKRAREWGIQIGVMTPGKQNAITDVAGVLVGQTTLIKGDSVRTGVTAILPYAWKYFPAKSSCGIICW